METSEHKDVVHNPISSRSNGKIEALQDQINILDEQLMLAHNTISSLTSLLTFERKRNADLRK